jgi:hypothetical protein
MNHLRYLSYRRVRHILDSERAAGLTLEERELIRDMAEQMLLTRSPEADDVEEVTHGAALALRTLMARRDLSRGTASELWEEICAAGPEPFQGASPAFPDPASLALRAD